MGTDKSSALKSHALVNFNILSLHIPFYSFSFLLSIYRYLSQLYIISQYLHLFVLMIVFNFSYVVLKQCGQSEIPVCILFFSQCFNKFSFLRKLKAR